MNDRDRLSRFFSSLFSWPTASLRTYLMAMILLATLPISGLTTYYILGRGQDELERMQRDMLRTAMLVAQSVNRELDSTIDALRILAYSQALQDGAVERFEHALRTYPIARPSWRGTYLVAPSGEVVFDTTPGDEKYYPTPMDRAELGQQPAGERALVSNLLSNTDANSFVTTIEVPVTIDGVAGYLLGARVPISVWQKLIEGSGDYGERLLALYDNKSFLIARNKASERFVGSRLSEVNQRLVSNAQSGSARLNTLEGSHAYAAWDTVDLSGWLVGVGTMAAPFDTGRQHAIVFAVGTSGACLLLGYLLALFAARKILDPLQQLSHNKIPSLVEPLPVREISLLRDAMVAAQEENQSTQEHLKLKGDLLQKRANEFETLFTCNPVGLAFAQDPQCRVVSHNPAMDRLFGSVRSRETGAVRVLENGRLLSREESPLQRAAALGETTQDGELELLFDGRPAAVVIVNAVPLRDTAGKPCGAIGTVVDITERKAAEQRLVTTEQRLRESQGLVDLAQEVGHVGFFHYRFEGDSFSYTPGFAKLFEQADTDTAVSLVEWARHIHGKDWRSILRRLRRALRQGQKTESLNYCVNISDGTVRWLSSRVHITYLDSGAPQHLIGVTVDVTEQKESERERVALIAREQAARLEAEAANRAKDVFLAMLGHELRNPLSAITAAIEVLNRTGPKNAIAVSAGRILSRQTRHLTRMMDDLLDVARVVSGQVLLARHSFDLAARVQYMVATLEISGQLSQHQLTLDLNTVWIDADPTRIEQIVTNLLVNALKYTPAAGCVHIHVGPDHGEAVFEIRDSGPGITPELLPRIFDLFVQGERSLDRRGGGLGIGLSVVRRLVELHGGTISVENADPGTRVRIRLPAIEAPPLNPRAAQASRSRRRCVVIIEDNEDVLQGMRSLLEIDGHTVWTATDGVGGLALLLDIRPDIALIDIGLPGLTGFEVAQSCRASGYVGRLIALSGYGQDSDVKQGLAAGFDAYLMKPIDSQKLLGLFDGE